MLQLAGSLRLAATSFPFVAIGRAATAAAPTSRVRPGDPAWPPPEKWKQLADQVGGALVEVRSPFAECIKAPSGAACAQLLKAAKNPYALGDDVGLTQTFGWVDAWTSAPSAYAVAARTHRRRRRRGQLRARATPAPRRQGRRPQLPGHVERAPIRSWCGRAG